MKTAVVVVAVSLIACSSDTSRQEGAQGGGAADGGATAQGGSSSSGLGGTFGQGGASLACESCADDELCDYFGDGCGPPEAGSCRPKTACAGVGPVCTCAGVVEVDDCAAYASGQDLSTTATCPTPADTFRCGGLFCTETSEICVLHNGLTILIECVAAPAECVPDSNGALSCDCVASLGCSCVELPGGQLQVTCNTD